MDWINLIQVEVWCRILANTAMNVGFYKRRRISSKLSDFQFLKHGSVPWGYFVF